MTTYYISTGGANGNAGTTTAGAWATLFRALSSGSVVTAGDTVMMLTGTYTVAPFTTNKGATTASPITVTTPTKWAAKIVGTGTGNDAPTWTHTGVGLILDKLDMSTTGRQAFYCTANNNTIRYCYIHDIQCTNPALVTSGGAGASCIGANWSVHHNLVVRVDVNRDTGNQVQGIYTSGLGALIYNNIVADIASYGIHQWHGGSEADIYNNTVLNCGQWGILVGSGDSGQLPSGSLNNNVYNNIVMNCTRGAIREYAEPSDMVSNTTIRSNLIFGCGVSPVTISRPSSDELGRISASARFVNYVSNGSGNYHLSAGSPAIGVANTGFVAGTDYDDVVRPQNGTYDVGAYEFLTVTPPTENPPVDEGNPVPRFGGNRRKQLRR